MSLDLLKYLIGSLKVKKEKIENGGINCIPLPFERLRDKLPGVQQKTLYVITGATKSSKTQLTFYLFVINTILYIYKHPNVIRAKIFFFPLEETKEQVSLRFCSFLLSYITNGRVNISPIDLESTDERKPLPQECLDLMDTEEFKNIWSIYEDIVEFREEKNPYGIYKVLTDYALTHGKIIKRKQKRTVKNLDGTTEEIIEEVFDRYEPDDPDEYVFSIVDHVGLLTIEKDLGTLKASIEKLSEYGMILRNRYKYSPIFVQQQNTETTNLDAFKANKIRPTKDGLKDCKRTGEDCTVLIGMTNPNAFGLNDYMGYQIKNGFGDMLRFLEIILNRNGQANLLCPLYFNGAINDFKEMPLTLDTVGIDMMLRKVLSIKNASPILFMNSIKNLTKKLHTNYIFNIFATRFQKN